VYIVGGVFACQRSVPGWRLFGHRHRRDEESSKSWNDYDIFAEIAKRLGKEREFTQGKTEMDWLRAAKQLGSGGIVQLNSRRNLGLFATPVFVVAVTRHSRPAPCDAA
jgi:hypothetical protein